MAKLRPINETRRPNGTLTSETAYRLKKRRAGLARARQMKLDGFSNITSQKSKDKSRLTRALKALSQPSHKHCKVLAEKVLALLATEHPTVYAALTKADLDKIS